MKEKTTNTEKKKREMFIKDIEKMSFKGGKNLSQEIDAIVYSK